jgi:hypothetical protein
MKDLAIIALKYLEPEWQQTLDCLNKQPFDVYFADRDGVGNMSRAFNEAFEKHVKGKYEYVWLVTNIIFDPDVPKRLLSAANFLVVMHDKDSILLHPVMNSSDHKHLHCNPEFSEFNANEVPFVELTAPMVSCRALKDFPLCEETPYYYMDLILSYQVKQAGGFVGVHNGVEVKHTYLRNKTTTHPISEIRKQLRNYHTPLSKKYMVETYGADWESKLWPK